MTPTPLSDEVRKAIARASQRIVTRYPVHNADSATHARVGDNIISIISDELSRIPPTASPSAAAMEALKKELPHE